MAEALYVSCEVLRPPNLVPRLNTAFISFSPACVKPGSGACCEELHRQESADCTAGNAPPEMKCSKREQEKWRLHECHIEILFLVCP